jgi:Na+/H+ antiporter NhaD/arsenite permease-like protein
VPDPQSALGGLLMLLLLLTAFFSMTRYAVPQALAMPLVACAFLGLQGMNAESVAERAFSHFASIAILFSAVAIPAHMIEKSQGFRWVAAHFGRRLGIFTLRHPRLAMPLLVVAVLVATNVLAGAMHNVTSILIMTPIIIQLCSKYALSSRWILSAALVASNLGGFSTKWGDTPNIVESRTWSLLNRDFLREVVPANLFVLSALIVIAVLLTWKTKDSDTFGTAMAAADYGREAADIKVDRRLLMAGILTLATFVVLQIIWPLLQIAIGSIIILVAVLSDRAADRLTTLKSLGYEVYLVFAAIFILAGCVEHSWIGIGLQNILTKSGAAPWLIAVTGYLGTSLTEAASWATVAAARIFPLAPSHAAAWALGGGICAGSSSIVTAASAGIILCEESRRQRRPEHTMTFGKYLPFGLAFSALMLIFYAVYFSLRRF